VKILKHLSEAMGVSGAEGEVRKLILRLIEKHVDDLQTDTLGNLIATKKGTRRGGLRVMVDAHMDEVGLMVIGYNGEGMLRVAAVGGLDSRILLGKRVLVGLERLSGVIGVKPVHLARGDERESVPDIDALLVDIGADSKASAEGKAPLGTRIGFESAFLDLGALVRGKSFDDRAGCAVLVHLLQGARVPFDLVASFTTQEEIGSRGAKVAAYRVKPDLALVIEGTIADDLPKEEEASPTTELGKGPALSLMDRSAMYDRRLNDWLVAAAVAQGIPYQFKQPGVGGTNAASIHLAQDGIPTAVISVPCRYIHSPIALLHKKDYRNTIRLARAALERLDAKVLQRNT
jgi:endoglucanase